MAMEVDGHKKTTVTGYISVAFWDGEVNNFKKHSNHFEPREQ